MIAAVVLPTEEAMGALGHQVAWDLEREHQSVQQHDGPLAKSERGAQSNSIGRSDCTPIVIHGMTDEVILQESDSKRAASVKDDWHELAVGTDAVLGANTSHKMRVRQDRMGLEA